tara:strand:- start:365 stop:673 length:309 start_codon:yes stop_codon:yes gene_type:complete
MSTLRPGDHVAYKPRVAPAIEMRETKIVGFDSIRAFNWETRKCDITGEDRPRQTANGNEEKRYVIEHYFGWYPSVQKGLNPDLDLDYNKRYYFAYESELRRN